MTQTMATASSARPDARDATAATLLLVGALAGPLFAVSAGIQILTRDGFDLTRHPISLLANGSLGWIQIATFVVTGLGAVSLAHGMRRVVTEGTGRRWLPRLVTAYGVGLIGAGVFTADPEDGFPVGTPSGPLESMSWHGVAHAGFAVAAFTALAVAAVIAAVRAGKQRRMLALAGHAATALVLLLPVDPENASMQVAATGLVAFSWTTIVALRLRRPGTSDEPKGA